MHYLEQRLFEALSLVVPKAEFRLCAKHIWANYKLQFTDNSFQRALLEGCLVNYEGITLTNFDILAFYAIRLVLRLTLILRWLV